ncbi:hypothetical protein ABZ766_12710 [Streptomyces sp. NPDC006670]|uniref:hypothetical protein n=1 Tax=Streptomyces sp. NPDC006670 TaxID=3154476 RepID=UPI0033FEB2CD
MSSRRDLPPPPPPAHLREWLDERVVRADRARFLADLSRRSLGLGRLALLWVLAAVFAVGWTFVSMAVMTFESGAGSERLFGAVFAAMGLAVLVPAGWCFVRGARQERRVHQLLCAWAVADRGPGADAGLRAPVRSAVWLLASLALGALGLWTAFAAASGARPGTDTVGEVAYFMGLGLILWVTALLGLAKAATHYSWSLRARPAPHPRRGRSGAPGNATALAHRGQIQSRPANSSLAGV